VFLLAAQVSGYETPRGANLEGPRTKRDHGMVHHARNMHPPTGRCHQESNRLVVVADSSAGLRIDEVDPAARH
jgi:hypothetical protein